MKKNTPNVATHLLENPKQYLLGLGGLLRKLSLDELPNLINIVRGEMVFVGPRPALYNQEDLMAPQGGGWGRPANAWDYRMGTD